MNVIIVAAGLGRRLMPLTKDCPKCLLKIGNARIIDITLGTLKKAGLDNVILVVGHQEQKIRDYLKDRVAYVTNPIFAVTNSMYSLSCAKDYFGEEFIYLHSDIIFEKAILDKIVAEDHDICLAVDNVVVDSEDMKVRCSHGLIKEINKAISLKDAAGEFIGIAKFRGNGIRQLIEAFETLLEDKSNYGQYFEYAVERIIKKGINVFPSLTEGKFYAEIDTVGDLDAVGRQLTLKGALLI